MVYIRLAGGLGNQIFQLGAGFLLAKEIDAKKVILDDSSLGKYEVKRENKLLNFFDFNKLDIVVEFKNSMIAKYRIPKLLPLSISKYPFVSDKNFQNALKNPNKYLIFLDGYFQECLTQNHFDKESVLLNKIFIRKDLPKQEGCVVHIRGGDFVKLGWNSVTPPEYYKKAITIMQSKYGIEKFKIITDDKEYATTLLNEINCNYELMGGSMYDDFYLIGAFQYRILSSSTFALWASALGDNNGSVVIGSEFWTPDHKRNILLPNEIRIEC